MSLLDQVNCVDDAGNTGIGQCYRDPKKIVGAFITPKGFTIPASALVDSATLLAYLQAATCADNKVNRIYPVGNFVQVDDQSSDMVKQEFQFGPSAPVRDGMNAWIFQFVKGGIDLLKKLRLFNKSQANDFLFFDDQNMLIGTSGLDSDGEQGLKAIPANYLWAHKWKGNTGAATAEYKLEFSFLPEYVNEYLRTAVIESDITSNVTGLIDVTLSGEVSDTPGTFDVQLTGGGINLGDLFATELANASVWTAKNTATGATITVSGVTYDADTKKFAVALSTTAPPYPASGTVTINLVGPTALAAADVVGYESTGALVADVA